MSLLTDPPPGAPLPAVSVILSVRNCYRYLDEALASVALQSFGDFEVVIVDNGSTDGSDRIVADWVRRDPRFRSTYLAQPGVSRALNHGVSLARAPLLARLDADDIALGDRLAIQLAAMRDDPKLGLLGGSAALIDERGRQIGERRHLTSDDAVRAYLRFGCPIITSTVMMRREVFDRVGGYREGLNFAEDYDLWCRIAEVSRVGNVDRVLARYRIHRDSATQRFASRLWLSTACVIAAQDARRLVTQEPFVAGRPSLRRALPLLGISRSAYLREVRPRLLRHRVQRFAYALPGSSALKRRLQAALRRMGLNRPYSHLLARLASRASQDPAPANRAELNRASELLAGEPVPAER